MSEKLIPEHVDPFRFAEQGLTIEGIVKIKEMERLVTNLINSENNVHATLKFGVDEQGITYVQGHLETSLNLQCQRCLEPYAYEIITDFLLGVVGTLDEANGLPERYEPTIATEHSLGLRDLIEDELILNLPIIPRHEPEACKVKLPLTDSKWDEGKGENPFQVLESLKHKQRSSSEK